MLGKSEAACRRSFSRAKQHLREHRPRYPASRETQRRSIRSGRIRRNTVDRAQRGKRADFYGDFDRWYATFWQQIGTAFRQAARTPAPIEH
jgi:hypothetical protein